jgi:hypothetical protein
VDNERRPAQQRDDQAQAIYFVSAVDPGRLRTVREQSRDGKTQIPAAVARPRPPQRPDHKVGIGYPVEDAVGNLLVAAAVHDRPPAVGTIPAISRAR